MSFTDIDDPTKFFQCTLYSGTGSSQAVTNGGNSDMQPDFVWTKRRDSTSGHHAHNSVLGANEYIFPNETAEISTDAQKLVSFNSNGFTVGTNGDANASGGTFVSWNWAAGTSFSNDASSTSIGSIDSAGSFNNDAGFSICSYTGTGSAGTIKHGLNSVPSWMLVKRLSGDTEHWNVYHASLGNTKAMQGLNNTGAVDTAASYWNNTSPTSSVFTVGTGSGVNASSPYICYAFSEKQGYSKFGSYVGNGNADGTFVFLGFKPAWIMFKQTNTTSNWTIYDTTRDTFNVMEDKIHPNTSGAESDFTGLDSLSNGFKFRTTEGTFNASGGSFIYMAFAKNPFVTSTGVPATAR